MYKYLCFWVGNILAGPMEQTKNKMGILIYIKFMEYNLNKSREYQHLKTIEYQHNKTKVIFSLHRALYLWEGK